MILQVVFARKHAPAVVALELLRLVRVVEVRGEALLASEHLLDALFLADLARELALRQHQVLLAHMPRQVVLELEHLVALVAREVRLHGRCRVHRAHMVAQVLLVLEHLAAVLAGELLGAVHVAHVHAQAALQHEHLAAVLALVAGTLGRVEVLNVGA